MIQRLRSGLYRYAGAKWFDCVYRGLRYVDSELPVPKLIILRIWIWGFISDTLRLEEYSEE